MSSNGEHAYGSRGVAGLSSSQSSGVNSATPALRGPCYSRCSREPSLVLYGQTFDEVDNLLRELISRSQVRYAMIRDLKGFVLMHARALWAPAPPSLDSLATLIASNYSANTAIANLFGEAGFKEMVQQGDQVGTYIEELGDKALLVSIFDRRAALGKVKIGRASCRERVK